jgi:hypothetical protein
MSPEIKRIIRDREIASLTILAYQADMDRISQHRAAAAAFALPQFEASIHSLHSQLEIPGLSSKSRIDMQASALCRTDPLVLD